MIELWQNRHWQLHYLVLHCSCCSGVSIACKFSLLVAVCAKGYIFTASLNFWPTTEPRTQTQRANHSADVLSIYRLSSSTVPIPRVGGWVFFFVFCFFFLTRRYSCIACWKCVDSVSTLSQCSCHWFSDRVIPCQLTEWSPLARYNWLHSFSCAARWPERYFARHNKR